MLGKRKSPSVFKPNVWGRRPDLKGLSVKFELPIHTTGQCLGHESCSNMMVDLANGWCVDHWDKGKQ